MRGGQFVVDGVFEFEGGRFSVRRWYNSVRREDLLIIYGGSRYEADPHLALVRETLRLSNVARAISDRYGVGLSGGEIVQRPEYAFERDPIARAWIRLTGANVVTGDGMIDDSERTGGELEFRNPEDAMFYLKFPRMLDALVRSFMEDRSETNRFLTRFGRDLEKHLMVMEGVQKLVEKMDEAIRPWPVRLWRWAKAKLARARGKEAVGE